VVSPNLPAVQGRHNDWHARGWYEPNGHIATMLPTWYVPGGPQKRMVAEGLLSLLRPCASVTMKLTVRVTTLARSSVLVNVTDRIAASYCCTVPVPVSTSAPALNVAARGDPGGKVCTASTSPLRSGDMVTLAELNLASSWSLTTARFAKATAAEP
jgi:hypothetical protein